MITLRYIFFQLVHRRLATKRVSSCPCFLRMENWIMNEMTFPVEQSNLEPLLLSPQKDISSQVDDSVKLQKPRRALSAYNLFFKQEREALLAELPVRSKGKPRRSHGKIGFQDMARVIANRWKNVDPERLQLLQRQADADKARYKKEMKAYKKQKAMTATSDCPTSPLTSSDACPSSSLGNASDPAVVTLARELDQRSIDFLMDAFR